MTTEKLSLPLNCIRTDGGTQTRLKPDYMLVLEYAEQVSQGVEFPPVDVFHDGSAYWLADGFHRFLAAEEAERDSINANVHQGTVRDAILFAVGANATHGRRVTNDDKRNAVMMLLRDAEWSTWSDREIGRAANVSHPFVAAYRRHVETLPVGKCPPLATKGKDGKLRKRPIRKSGLPGPESISAAGDNDEQGAIQEAPFRPRLWSAESAAEPDVCVPQGVGVRYANEAIDCLKAIPHEDPTRSLGISEVAKWIAQNPQDFLVDVTPVLEVRRRTSTTPTADAEQLIGA